MGPAPLIFMFPFFRFQYTVKASQSFAALAAKTSEIIFPRGMYVGKNTSHGGNVRPLGRALSGVQISHLGAQRSGSQMSYPLTRAT